MATNHLAALWDVDGTLVDTSELHFQAWCILAREMDRPFTRADFAGTFGWRNAEIIPKVFNIDGPEEIAALSDRKEICYRASARNGVSLLPGVRALLEGLHAAGFQQAVGSSAPRANVDLILELTDIKRFFPAIVSMEDTQRGKPDPEVFLLAAQRLGVPPQRSLVFEDAPVGIQAAKAGGMRAIGVRFIPNHSEESLRLAGADLVAPSLADITADMVRALIHQS